MNETLSSQDRRPDRMWLIAALAVVFTLVLSALTGAGVNRPQAEVARPVAAVVAAATENAPEVTDIDPGCGCAESCFAACYGLD